MVGENFRNCKSETAKIAFQLSTMVGENFGNCIPETDKVAFKMSTMFEKILEITHWKKMRKPFIKR